MKKLLVILLAILISGHLAIAEESTDIDMQANSLYAANRLEDAYNILVSIPQYKRTPEQMLLMGNIMMDYGRMEDAEFMYNSALGLNPRFYKAYYNLGNIYLQQDKPNMAINSYKLAIRYKREFAPAHYNLGCAYLKQGELKKAKNAFHDAIFYKPNVADYHYNLAYVYKKLGKDKNAKLYLDYYNKIENNY